MNKHMMKIVIALSLATSTAAVAGYKFSQGVNIILANKHAYGSLGSARNSANTVEYLGCYVQSYNTGSASVGCFAKDAAGTSASCYSSNPELVKAAQALNGDSYLQFKWDDTGSCTYILAHNHSQMEPKQP